jgi:hypothetical protein
MDNIEEDIGKARKEPHRKFNHTESKSGYYASEKNFSGILGSLNEALQTRKCTAACAVTFLLPRSRLPTDGPSD